MYTFFTDKQEVFECKISLQGASYNNSKARLVLESDNMNFIFYGKINSEGKCTVPVNKLKNYLTESTKGTVKLEVIAEDTFFEPWSDKFEVQTAKKVTVEVKSAEPEDFSNTKKIMVSEVKNNNVKTTVNKINKLSEEFYKLLVKNKVTVSNLNENTKLLNKLGYIFIQKYKLTESQRKQLIDKVILKLTN